MSSMLRAAFGKDSRLIALALALLILALVVPAVELPRDTFDYVVVFDISQSMNVEDYELDGEPVSRLAFARAAARQTLHTLPCGSRVGWGAFTGYRTVLLLAPVEVCANYDDLLVSLDKIDGRMRWSNASEVMKGLYWSVLAAQATNGQPDIVFLSDGQEAPPLDPIYAPQVLQELKSSPIRGWLIGTGSPVPSPIPRIDEDGRRDGYWRADEVVQTPEWLRNPNSAIGEHLSGLREAHLRSLSEQIRFGYARLSDLGSLSDAMRDPDFARRRPSPTDLSWVPVALSMLLLVARYRPRGRSRA
ncbi:vWA domain-containing protein [Povalibacter sp.]|uniref:vWA domain-containing protein n=1 Tax=Povalibacter sp. TaxID=1962978 RepID=UPI002F429DFC